MLRPLKRNMILNTIRDIKMKETNKGYLNIKKFPKTLPGNKTLLLESRQFKMKRHLTFVLML